MADLDALGGSDPPESEGDGEQVWRALVIGVTYDDPAMALPYPVDDAAKIADLLEARGYRVTRRLATEGHERPTRESVRKALHALVAKTDEDDVLLVYFNGHGTRDDTFSYLFLADTPPGDEAAKAHGMKLCELLGTLRGKKSRFVGVFLDACYMGMGMSPQIGQTTRLHEERKGAFALLSGSQQEGITQDSFLKSGGIFTSILLEGLRGAAADPDGGVRFSALAQHVQRGVAAWRESQEGKDKQSEQKPVLRLEIADLQILPPDGTSQLAATLPAPIRGAVWTGDELVTACDDGTVRRWSAATGAELATVARHAGPVSAVACSPAGVLASASQDGVRIGEATVAIGAAPTSLAWSPDGAHLAVGTTAGLRVITVATRAVHAVDGGTVWSVAYLPDGRIARGGADGEVHVAHVPAKRGAGDRLGHGGPVWAIAVSPDGTTVAAAGTDATPFAPMLLTAPKLWSLATRETLHTFAGYTSGVAAIAFSPDGAHLATAGHDGRVRLWRTADGTLARELALPAVPGTRPPEALALAFAPGGARLFVGFADGRGRFYRVTAAWS
jgi:WD40 repeat protein